MNNKEIIENNISIKVFPIGEEEAKDMLDRALVQQQEEFRKPLGIVLDYVERWNKKDEDKEVAEAVQTLLDLLKGL